MVDLVVSLSKRDKTWNYVAKLINEYSWDNIIEEEMKKRSEKNKKLEDEVWELCKEDIGTEHTMDMTDEMHTLYCWA